VTPEAHEVICRHVATARAMKDDGAKNDMLGCLAGHGACSVPVARIAGLRALFGRAVLQVDEFR
jgi:hypothetical protein